MKIATFNVNGIKSRLPQLLQWLLDTRPEIACLQEIKTGDATFPHEAIEEAGYRVIWPGQPRHHGVAILSRIAAPEEVRRGLPGDDSDAQARYLEADVGPLRVASLSICQKETPSQAITSLTSCSGLNASTPMHEPSSNVTRSVWRFQCGSYQHRHLQRRYLAFRRCAPARNKTGVRAAVDPRLD